MDKQNKGRKKTHLTPKVHCSRVMIPETKMMVETMALRTGSFSSMHKAGVKMKGTDIVPPNIIK